MMVMKKGQNSWLWFVAHKDVEKVRRISEKKHEAR